VLNIERFYRNGFQGIVPDPAADEELRSFGYTTADEALAANGLAGVGEGKLVLPYLNVLKYYPTAYPGPAQRRGDCVVHSTVGAALTTMCCEVASGEADAVTGKVEEAPPVSATAEAHGVLATEPPYHYRTHSGDGWWSRAAVNTMIKFAGAVLRKDYGFVNLEKYNPEYAGKYWKADQVPEEAKSAFDDNRYRDAAECKTFEAVRDSLAAGIGVSGDGPEGFGGTRDENGVMPKRGSWAHAMQVSGCDDREITKQKYGGPLLLFKQSWGVWGSGPRKILGTDLEIPVGFFWVRWSDVRTREYTAIAGLHGWARKALPDLNPGWR